MPFDNNGYTPRKFDDYVEVAKDVVNTEFGTNYTTQDFRGSGFYRFLYTHIQLCMTNETNFSEIYNELKNYIINENLSIKTANISENGIINFFKDKGLVTSIAPITENNIGKLYLAVDYNDDTLTPKIAEYIALSKAAGIQTIGDIKGQYTLSNGQSLTFYWRKPLEIHIKVTYTLHVSSYTKDRVYNNSIIEELIKNNIAANYSLGKNFELQKYLSIIEGPANFASDFSTSFDLMDSLQLNELKELNPSIVASSNLFNTIYLKYYQKIIVEQISVLIS